MAPLNRDPELFRKILVAAGQAPTVQGWRLVDHPEGYSYDIVQEHLRLLQDQRLIEINPDAPSIVIKLTNRGYDAVEKISDENLWGKVTNHLKEKGPEYAGQFTVAALMKLVGM